MVTFMMSFLREPGGTFANGNVPATTRAVTLVAPDRYRTVNPGREPHPWISSESPEYPSLCTPIVNVTVAPLGMCTIFVGPLPVALYRLSPTGCPCPTAMRV